VADGTVRIQTRQGVFAVAVRHRSLAVQQRVTFVVRADLMRTGATDRPMGENTVSGVIKGLEYAGSVILMVLDVGEGQELKLEQHESLSQGEAAPRHGARLTVAWTASDAYLLPTSATDNVNHMI
jgi:hypothetical protein